MIDQAVASNDGLVFAATALKYPSFMDAGSRGEGQSAQGDYGTDDRRGFRGTAENAKTKICMRSAG